MKIKIIFTVKELEKEFLEDKIVVVVDTLRATSTIITALSTGVKSIKPKLTPKQVLKEKKHLCNKNDVLFCGEKNGVKVNGFNLGNSPLEYTSEKVKEKHIVLSTTNGTKAIVTAENAAEVLIAALLNRKRVAKELIKKNKDVIICCAGTRGKFSLEDFITAGSMVDYLKDKGLTVNGDDRVVTAQYFFQDNKYNLLNILNKSENGRRLINNEKEKDLKFSAQLDKYSIVGYLEKGFIRKLES